jgi:hypothetical protein
VPNCKLRASELVGMLLYAADQSVSSMNNHLVLNRRNLVQGVPLPQSPPKNQSGAAS